jgi:hypothetical protein
MAYPTASTSAQAYPHTARSLRDSLLISEQALQQYMEALALPLRNDPLSGALVFSQDEAELIQQTHHLLQRQPGTQLDADTTDAAEATPPHVEPRPMAMGASLPNRGMALPNPLQTPLSTSPAVPAADLALLVETVSASRGDIINAVTQLIDDRLAGLDEVIVELIRCKTENEGLRHKLGSVLKEKEHLADELQRFRPVQFGFYKKLGSP